MAVVNGQYINTGDSGGGLFAALSPAYQQQQLAVQQGQMQLNQERAFQNGIPTNPDGSTDYTGMAQRLTQLGDYGNADKFLQTGISQQFLKQAQQPSSVLGGAGGYGGGQGGAAPAGANGGSGVDPMDVYAHSIGNIESSNKYDALGPKSNGDRAYGRYQVMGSNIGPWTQQVLGQAMSPSDFLANPQAQDAVFKAKFGQAVQQYGNPADAASVWFSGRPIARAGNASDSLGTTVPSYVSKFLAGLGPASQAVQSGQGNGAVPTAAAASASGGSSASQSPLISFGGNPAGSQAASAQPPAASAQPTAAGAPIGDNAVLAARNRLTAAQDLDPSSLTTAQQKQLTADTGTVATYTAQQAQPQVTATAGTGDAAGTDGSQGARPLTIRGPGNVQVAQNGDSDAPQGTHPFGGTPASAPAAPPQAAAIPASGIPAPSAAVPPPAQRPPMVAPPTGAQVRPAAVSPPPAGQTPVPGLLDPTMNGLVTPQQLAKFGSAGGVAQAALDEASGIANNPYMKGRVEQLKTLATGIMSALEKANIPTPEQKNARDADVISYQNTLAQQKAQARVDAQNSQTAITGAGQRAKATADANVSDELVPSVQPDGSTIMVTKSQALANANAGNPVTSAQPGYITQGQAALQTKLSTGSAAYQERQSANQRLDAMSKLLENYQTGTNSTAFSNAVANLQSYGIKVPTTAMANPAAMQQFAKDGYANVLSSMKEQGNKQYAAEVQSAVNSNPNPELQPEANAAMIAQMQGIKKYTDQNFRDYSKWYHQNKGAADDADFQTGWADKNDLGSYISDARKEIAPMGIVPPAPADRPVGQKYMIPGRGVFRWNGSGWTAP